MISWEAGRPFGNIESVAGSEPVGLAGFDFACVLEANSLIHMSFL